MKDLTFRVETDLLLREIIDCAMPRNMGILKIPINIFRRLLVQVAQRAIEIDDPQLNILMLSLGLYEVHPEKVTEEIEKQKLRKQK